MRCKYLTSFLQLVTGTHELQRMLFVNFTQSLRDRRDRHHVRLSYNQAPCSSNVHNNLYGKITMVSGTQNAVISHYYLQTPRNDSFRWSAVVAHLYTL